MGKELVDLSGLMAAQTVFERVTTGTDMSMAEHNSPLYIIDRGVHGELEECRVELEQGNIAAAKIEAVDALIFIASLFNHLGMSPEEVSVLAELKMMTNFYKYNATRFEGKTLEEGIRNARDVHAQIKRRMYGEESNS